MKRAALLVLLLMLGILSLCGAACAGEAITSKEQLNREGKVVATGIGSAAVLIVEQELPNAELVVYLGSTDGYEAVAQGKIDAYIYDRRQMELAIKSGRTGVHLLDEDMEGTVSVAAGISPVSQISGLEEKINAFIAEIKKNGTLDDMFRRWVEESNETMPDIAMPADPEIHLAVGTSGVVPPFSYYIGTKLSGYDIEMAYRFAAWLNADVTFKVYDYDAIIAAAASGDVDVIMADLNVTPERAEALTFSDPFFVESVAIMVKGDPEPKTSGAVPSLDQLNGKRCAVLTGTISGEVAQSVLPDIELDYYNSAADCLTATRTRKVEFFVGDEPVIRYMMIGTDDLQIAGNFDSSSLAAVFAKTDAGRALCERYSAFVDKLWADGTMGEIDSIWFSADKDKKTVLDYENLPDVNGTLYMAVDTAIPPFAYVKDNQIVGYDVDIAARFCEANGYRLKVVPMDFGGMLPAVQKGKCDFAACCITVTEERAQSVLFSSATYHSGTVAVVRRDVAVGGASADGAQSGIAASFYKTFIREDRWQLFLSGVYTTLLITLLSILFGTLVGFGVFLLCRNGNPVANVVTRFSMWLVQGMPMVVLLMILYYIVFGSVPIGGVAVAVIGFTLTFGSAVFGLLKMGVGTVDRGQYEAAYALGYSNRRTFFRIILPQALPHVLPAYRGEVVGLIKATSIVGYIAVQDLTKMGDIVRSRTYEAFFPLIAVTIIYFILEGLVKLLVGSMTTHLEPRRRQTGDILKGVKTDG